MVRQTKENPRPRTRKENAVWLACDALHSKDKVPTYLAIGQQLVDMGYKRGSNSDIRRYLNSWKEQNPASKNVQAKSTTKPAPSSAISSLPKQLVNCDITVEKLLELYNHHVQQIDRLLNIIELQKHENRTLRKRLSTQQASTSKPRVRVTG
jgi:hypothetical protein